MDFSERFFSGRKVLVVAPHADDEAIGCGGTMLRAREAGARVFNLVVSVGDLRRVGDGAEIVTGAERVHEVERVSRFLGVEDFEVIMTDEESHLRLDALPRRDLTAWLERDARLSIDRVRPDVVLLPAPSYNQDHEAVAKAGLVACRPHDPKARPVPSAVLLYEYPPNSWCLPQERFSPQAYVEITDLLEKKLEAYRMYASQARTGLHQNTPENVRDLARLRGKEAGVEAAEAFQVLRLRL